MEVIEKLIRRAVSSPQSEAIREIDHAGRTCRILTYGQLGAASLALAEHIEQQWPDGVVVLISFPNQFEFAIALFGVLAAGGAAFPVHPGLTDLERAAAARRSGAAAIMGTDKAAHGLVQSGLIRIPCGECSNNRVARDGGSQAMRSGRARLLLQSSGTTGQPKIVERSAAAVDAVARNVAETVPLESGDRVWGQVPISHAYGVESVMLGPVWAGCCAHLCQHVNTLLHPRAHDEPSVTVFPGAPSLFELYSSVGDGDLDSKSLLRGIPRVYSAGARLPQSVSEAFYRRYGRQIGQLYGMTEVGSVTFNHPTTQEFDGQCVGLPMNGVTIRIVDPGAKQISCCSRVGCEGEVAVATPSMMTGYLRDDVPICEPPDTLVDGFFRTGDLGRIDACGRLTITGRVKLVVDVGGLKVNLMEVEQALCQHSAVRECVVVPVAISQTVSRLNAYVVPREGMEISPDELRSFLRPRLSAYKIPRSFELRDSFPRSPSGKILRQALIEEA